MQSVSPNSPEGRRRMIVLSVLLFVVAGVIGGGVGWHLLTVPAVFLVAYAVVR